MAIKVTGAKDEAFGVIFATARTQVDKIARTVVFEDYNITKIDFPTLPNQRRGLLAGAHEGVHEQGQDDLARSPAVLARRGRHSAADGRGAEQPAAGHRQLRAGAPGADRRRAGV
jgi:hypothetical protein